MRKTGKVRTKEQISVELIAQEFMPPPTKNSFHGVNVIDLKNVSKSRSRITQSRCRVLERDGFKCVSCGATEKLTIDHKEPGRGREKYKKPYILEDCRTLCAKCHAKENRALRRRIKKEGLL